MRFFIALAIALVITGGLWLTVELLIPQLFIELAKFDTGWSPFMRRPPEGQMYVVVRGSPDGPFDQIIESVPNYDYDPNSGHFVQVPPESNKERKETYLSRLGIVITGFNKYLLYREIKYDKYEKQPGSNKWGLVEKVRPGPEIFFQYVMGTQASDVETVGNFKVNAMVNFTVRIINPIKALFFAGGWETQVNAKIQGVLREYIGTRDINQLRQEKTEGGSTNMIGTILALNTVLEKEFGVSIIDATFVDYDLVGDDKEASAAVQAVEIATLKGDADVVSATKEARAARIRAKGESDAQKTRSVGIAAELKVRHEHDPSGVYSTAEAIKVAKPTAIGGNILASIAVEKS